MGILYNMVKLKFDLVEEYKKFEMDIQLEIASYFKGLVFQKNAYLLREGHICEGIYYIEKGCCRSFTHSENKEITTAFSIEHSIITSPQSYLMQVPSFENIQALEYTEVFFLHYDHIQYLLQKHVVFNDYVRKLYEKIFIDADSMLYSIRSESALQRYERLMETQPYLIQRVSLGHIASYLGMSQETLSRMRSQICT